MGCLDVLEEWFLWISLLFNSGVWLFRISKLIKLLQISTLYKSWLKNNLCFHFVSSVRLFWVQVSISVITETPNWFWLKTWFVWFGSWGFEISPVDLQEILALCQGFSSGRKGVSKQRRHLSQNEFMVFCHSTRVSKRRKKSFSEEESPIIIILSASRYWEN